MLFPKPGDLMEHLLKRSVRRLVLQLTSRCNFGCTHCYVAAVREGPTLARRQIERAVDLYASLEPASPIIAFYGRGEAMMAFEELKHAVRVAEDKFDSPHFRIMTHGGLNRAQRKFIAEHRFFVIISYDGPHQTFRQVGEKSGVATAIAEQGLAWCSRHLPDEQFMAAVTFTPETYTHCFELADSLCSLGVRQVSFYPLVPEGRGKNVSLPNNYLKHFHETRRVLENVGLRIYSGTSGGQHETTQTLSSVPYGGGNYFLSDMIVTPLGFLTANRNVEGPHQGRDYLYGRITDQGVRIDAEAVKMLYHRLEVQGEACRISECSAYEGCWGLIKAFPITNNVELLCSFAQQSSN